MQGEDLRDTYRKRETKNKTENKETRNSKVHGETHTDQKGRGAPRRERGGIYTQAKINPKMAPDWPQNPSPGEVGIALRRILKMLRNTMPNSPRHRF